MKTLNNLKEESVELEKIAKSCGISRIKNFTSNARTSLVETDVSLVRRIYIKLLKNEVSVDNIRYWESNKLYGRIRMIISETTILPPNLRIYMIGGRAHVRPHSVDENENDNNRYR